ncbi:mechanosensitive ion channel domain-containing protein [Sulfurimonas sp.]|uniref:mechanosensitive ion channel family protein n=1 Tax=Sulfurimonas sp. TaxID=2022749 RepID=UPI002629B94C|nr:mechanosensitive ion channel domain-containing protein [Sulfurimonas sp.]MCW8894577.1 mechanosensitive ion channel [Sulfurimonas sp.]
MDFSKYTDMAITYTSEYGLKIIAALIIFFIGKLFVKKITKFSKKVMHKAKVDETLAEFLESIIYFLLLIMVILASLNTLGINTTSFLAVFGAASLAIGLALKDSLSNIGAAVLIIIFRPFKVGDVIEAAGTTGTVKDVNLFSTIIEPVDKRIIIVPNSSIIGGNITNFSQRTMRRVEHVFGIGYDDDLKLAKETLMQIIKDDERILEEPAPLVAVGELGDSSVNFTFRAWVKADDYWDVHFDMLEKVKLTFDEKGISIPYPQMDIHTDKTES